MERARRFHADEPRSQKIHMQIRKIDKIDRIDSHHHLWRYSRQAYPWISPEMKVLERDFLPEDLEPELERHRISGSIAVQARQTMEETSILLAEASQHAWIRGVVGWAPIASQSFPAILERLCEQPKLKGLRHVIQDEPDDDFILGQDFNRGIRRLHATGLVYDILIKEKHLPQTIQFVDRHPEQVFILDHMAKPRIAAQELSPWRERIRELAERENVYCKISGMVTEAAWDNWNAEQLRPYYEIVLENFGPRRLMMGSDWPVCLLATSYSRWIAVLEEWIGALSAAEQSRIVGGTAVDAYRLAERPSHAPQEQPA